MNAGVQLPPAYRERSDVIEMFEGDAEFADDLAAQFAAECPVTLHDMQEALAASDVRGVSRAAHALKGSLAYFDPGPGHVIVEAIERIRSGDLVRLRSLVGALEIRMAGLTRHLAAEFRTAAVAHPVQ